MKRNLFLLVASFLFLGSIHAQENHWNPETISNGDCALTVWAHVYINEEFQSSNDVEVAMFFDDICRATVRVRSDHYSGNYTGVQLFTNYMSASSGPTSYEVTFKCYDHASETEYEECSFTYTATGGTVSFRPTDDIELRFTSSFKKSIDAYTTNGGYYLIASPIGQVSPVDVENMTSNDFDLYYFDQNPSDGLEWINYEGTNGGGFNLEAGKGYLYANSQDVVLKFVGAPHNGNGQVTLVKAEGVSEAIAGWNLVGNPFAQTAYITKPFYTMNEGGSEIIAAENTTAVGAMEGIFVIADQDGEVLTFSLEQPNSNPVALVMNVTNNRSSSVIDRAIIDFNEGSQLPKFMLNENNTKLFIVQEDKDYALVHSEGQDAMPVNFKASENGTYTISVATENVEMEYLHLIDNVAGTDIDLLQTPNYTFEASTTDSESRFVLEFATRDLIQDPDCPWTLDPNSFKDNAIAFAVVQLDGVTIEDGTNWVVGAFCGDDCRGIGSTWNNAWTSMTVPNVPYTYWMLLTIHGNAGNSGDEISFKLYDKEAGKEYPGVCDTTVTWYANAMWGSINDPFIMNFVTPSFTKDINAYTETGGYYLIASPIGQVSPEDVNSMLDNTYDLYYFDQNASDGLEWINYKPEGSFDLVAGKGYLYANSDDVTLTFTGMPYDGDGEVTLDKDSSLNEGGIFEGWNLVGNPFAQTAYITKSFYTMNEDGSEIILAECDSVQAMEGVFVIAEEDGEVMTFTTELPAKSREQIVLNVNRNRGKVIDRAIVRFGEEKDLPKFQLNRNNTKLYIPQNGMDYAEVNAEAQAEIPVNFVAAENGVYSISVNVDEVSVNYLHLIDNLTHADVDLLATPSYNFEVNTTDSAARFKLVFICGNADSDNDFAFFSNGSWVINNEGNATLQVVDANGRILSSEQISGCCSKSIKAAAGVYMLRLVNGDNVKVQKVVVE